MKLRITSILLLVFFIYCLVIATPALFSQAEAKPHVDTISQQVSDVFQHNALLVQLTKLQQSLNKDIAMKIKELKQQEDPLLLVSLLFMSFIYGIVHAIGPGHGKSIISSWIIAQQRKLSTVIFVSGLAAAAHALSATLIVGGTYVLLGKFATVSTQKLNVYLQIAAAILIIGMGLAMLIRLVHGRFSQSRSDLGQALPSPWESPSVVALSIGVVPCPVTSVVLIFCLTLGLIWQGLLLVLSFAAGMGISLITIAFLVWSCKEKITPKKLSGFHHVVTHVFPAIGGIFLVTIGSAILYSLL
ncbi:nickel/cobalt transporter [Sporomusa sphaeroides]|uniref:Nickel/cobalt efflux system n=1 Tax=Sporomusa sphaeroides DSM 2875 TaxID=1337886 RepID=A0ABM9W2I8_9FIRM|nr:sulfite exporter TauE/SafE family protein [Sporomusa sphaeroides]OLS55773.1 nickel/cobalt efflux protein RcnA [Sporomusa sphaeroides DSM 2875]CVK19301.1 nickel/cobalt efflux protein RcnA [Sporomusa sphaeroides DSM 2875]